MLGPSVYVLHVHTCHRLSLSVFQYGFLIPFLLSFFLRRSTTRILNRFSGDIEVIDNELGSAMAQVFSSLMNVIGALIAIVAATNGTFAPVAVPIIIGTRKSRTRESREHAVQMGIVWV